MLVAIIYIYTCKEKKICPKAGKEVKCWFFLQVYELKYLSIKQLDWNLSLYIPFVCFLQSRGFNYKIYELPQAILWYKNIMLRLISHISLLWKPIFYLNQPFCNNLFIF